MRTFAIVMVGLLIVAASAFATPTRTLVMGNNDMVMVDDGNMFTFYGRINNYPDLAMGEFANYYDYSDYFWQLGVTWKFGEENPWVLGTFINTDPSVWPVSYNPTGASQLPVWYDYTMEPISAPAELDADSYNPRRFQFIVGHNLGGQKFGFSLEAVRINEKYDGEDFQPEQSFSQYTFGVGLTEATSGQWDVGMSLMMGSWTDKDPNGDDVTKPNGYMELGVAGRYFMVQSPKMTLVPHLATGIGKRGVDNIEDPEDDDYTWTEEWSRFALNVGMGLNYAPAEGILAVADLGVAVGSIKGKYTPPAADEDGEEEEIKFTEFTLPYLKLGFEGTVCKWLDVRAGGTATLYTDKWQVTYSNDDKYSFDEPNTNTYVGFGLHFGKLYFDTYMDPEWLLDGPNFISGAKSGDNSEWDNMNFEVSMLYELF